MDDTSTQESTQDSSAQSQHADIFQSLIKKKLFRPYGKDCSGVSAKKMVRLFVLTYRYHASPQTFLQTLTDFYNFSKKKGKANLVKLVLNDWVYIENQKTLKRAGVIDGVLDLLTMAAGQGEVNRLKLQLLKAGKKQPAVVDIDESNFNIVDFISCTKAPVLARHLTAIDWEYFCGIEVKEIVFRAWQGKDRHTKAPTLTTIAERFDRVSFFIASHILSTKDARERVKVLTYFLKVMHELRRLNNFQSLMMILSGLNMSVVQRLKTTWAEVPSKYMDIFSTVDELMTPVANMKNYRDALVALQKSEDPILPYVAMYLRDVTYVFDGNPDFTGTGSKTAINFEKMELLAAQLGRLKDYQTQKKSNVFLLDKVDTRVHSVLLALPKVIMDEEVLYDMSVQCLTPVPDPSSTRSSDDAEPSARSPRSGQVRRKKSPLSGNGISLLHLSPEQRMQLQAQKRHQTINKHR